jgi:hypothetical protein
MLDEFRSLQAAIERAVDRVETRTWVGPCLAEVRTMEADTLCMSELFARDGVIKCDGWHQDQPGCGKVHDPADRRDWLLQSLEDAVVPLSELLAALPDLMGVPMPPKVTVRQWRFQKRLPVHNIDRYGVELYRGGDLINLVNSYHDRRTA